MIQCKMNFGLKSISEKSYKKICYLSAKKVDNWKEIYKRNRKSLLKLEDA